MPAALHGSIHRNIKEAIKERFGVKNDSDISPKVCTAIAAWLNTTLVQVIEAEAVFGGPFTVDLAGKTYYPRQSVSEAMYIFTEAARTGRGYHFTRVR